MTTTKNTNHTLVVSRIRFCMSWH